ncbi:MAG: cysteine desulfurase [Planctomycetaceae bacterium]|nr:cysteine desulfurase [Planctomycetaceae bacterium]
MSAPIYLDGNATTPPLPEVLELMYELSSQAWGNPGSRHGFGRKARRVLEESRETIAEILDAEPEEVVFTSGGTESNNLAIFGLARGSRKRLVSPPGEHPATRQTCLALVQQGWSIAALPIDANGLIQRDEIENIVTGETGLVTALVAHNETGILQNVAPLVERAADVGCPVHLDAVQAVGRIPVSFRELGSTTLSFAAHKFHGPRGIGGLLVRQGTRLTPVLHGGHQEAGLRPGTEPVILAAGMAHALSTWHRERATRIERMTRQRDELEQRLTANAGPLIVHGQSVSRIPNTSCIGFPEVDGEALLVNLDLEGIACSLGTTCASGSAEAAEVLLAMGVSPELAKSSIRFSLTALTTDAEIEAAAERISRVVARLRQNDHSTTAIAREEAHS